MSKTNKPDEIDTIKEELIKRNIDEEFYNGIQNAMKLYNEDRFCKPTIAQLVTLRTNEKLVKNGCAWITTSGHETFNKIFTTEIFVQQQEKHNNGLVELLFESGIIAYFENHETDPIRDAAYDPRFYVIELGKVFIRNKEFYNLLMTTLQSRKFYRYPTLVIVDKNYMSYSKDDVLYYDFKEIIELGYFDIRKFIAACDKRESAKGEELNRVIKNAAKQ